MTVVLPRFNVLRTSVFIVHTHDQIESSCFIHCFDIGSVISQKIRNVSKTRHNDDLRGDREGKLGFYYVICDL